MTPANLSVLKNGKAKGVRFSTLEPICEYLQCQPGDLIEYVPDDELDSVLPNLQKCDPREHNNTRRNLIRCTTNQK